MSHANLTLKDLTNIPEELKNVEKSIEGKNLTELETSKLFDCLYMYAFAKKEAYYYILENIILKHFATPPFASFEEAMSKVPKDVGFHIKTAFMVLAMGLRNKVPTA